MGHSRRARGSGRFASSASSACVLRGLNRLRAYALVMPCSRMMPPMRLLDAVTPILSKAALIFLAPQHSRLSRRTARTSPAIGSARSVSGCSIIQ